MTVVVGVSPTTGSPAALRWGAEEARLRGVPLVAVLAWRPPRPPGAPGGRPPVGVAEIASEDPAAEADNKLRSYVADALGADVDVECVAVRGSEVNALLSAAKGAQLLVVGEPRPGRLASMLASLVAPQLVLKAHCPVVVMPSAAALAS